METLVVPAEHRNQCYGRVKSYGPGRFVSSPSKNFRDINCRTFQSGVGLLPTPYRANSTPITKRTSQFLSPASSLNVSPRSISPAANPHSVDKAPFKTNAKSSPIPIASNGSQTGRRSNGFFDETRSLSCSELWAGPTYSNSPPPSSVPIPKFSLRQKRTVSLNLSVSDHPAVDIHPVAKSAPASPTREHNSSAEKLFLNTDSATKTLRRILNLDIADE